MLSLLKPLSLLAALFGHLCLRGLSGHLFLRKAVLMSDWLPWERIQKCRKHVTTSISTLDLTSPCRYYISHNGIIKEPLLDALLKALQSGDFSVCVFSYTPMNHQNPEHVKHYVLWLIVPSWELENIWNDCCTALASHILDNDCMIAFMLEWKVLQIFLILILFYYYFHYVFFFQPHF